MVKQKTQRLDVLMRKYLPNSEIGLLCVDVEGHELEVLRSLVLDDISPLLIVVELHDFDLSQQNQSPVFKYLTKFHYLLRAYDGVNAYFLRAKP